MQVTSVAGAGRCHSVPAADAAKHGFAVRARRRRGFRGNRADSPQPFVIGRVEGNLTIPHDGGISSRHVEISRRLENGEHCWYLKDLQSTNGTFVRASTVMLSHEQEVLIGGRRLRFELPEVPEQPAVAEAAGSATRKWESLSGSPGITGLMPALVDLLLGRPPRRFTLRDQENWLGRDPTQCSVLVDDPMVDRRHARVYRDEKNRWLMANARSRNGLWVRIQEVAPGAGGSSSAVSSGFS